jgi:2-polyprenyl-3-methyl-5-hydroxy-6-metoxy-1,4-benzoquinol methylase
VRDGIVDMLRNPPEFVVRETDGLKRFADHMRAKGWDRAQVLRLPYAEDGYWFAQAIAMQQVLEDSMIGLDLAAGGRLLDVGSNTCWASAVFAERGLEVVALDIAAHEMQGLRTADWWFDDRNVYFERVLSVMFEPALASECFDVIWCCEVLHHNAWANVKRTLRELHRLLKPGGRLIVVNEPVRSLRSPKLRPGLEVADFDGHEHAYLRRNYLRAARAAGFDVHVVGSTMLAPYTEVTLEISPRMSTISGVQAALTHTLRRHRGLRAAYLAWKTYVDGISLQFIGTKTPM